MAVCGRGVGGLSARYRLPNAARRRPPKGHPSKAEAVYEQFGGFVAGGGRTAVDAVLQRVRLRHHRPARAGAVRSRCTV